MIGYVTLGTNDKDKAAAFYDELLAGMGAKRLMEDTDFIAWGADPEQPMLGIFIPFDKQPATVGNGVMVAFQAESHEQVQSLHAKALALGGTSEGEPGDRGQGFYAAYCRDLDGNKLAFFKMG